MTSLGMFFSRCITSTKRSTSALFMRLYLPLARTESNWSCGPHGPKTKKVGGYPTWRSLGPAQNAPGNAPRSSGGRFGELHSDALRIEQVSILHSHRHRNFATGLGTYSR